MAKSELTLKALIHSLEQKAPLSTAETWDNVGLLAGDPSSRLTGAVVSVDLTREAIETALQTKSNLIVNHHPAIFPKQKGINRLVHRGDGAHDSGSLLYRAVQSGIAVYAAHTNFDQCALEVTSQITGLLGATPRGRILEKRRGQLLKLVVFVPEANLEAVRSAIFEAGAGHIGQYDSCSFAVAGHGTFRGLPGANPVVGKVGKLETASEYRLETILPRGLERAVIEAMRKAHPYEEVAYDLFAVEQPVPLKGIAAGLGYGFSAEWEKPKTEAEWASLVKAAFQVDGFWATRALNQPSTYKRLAFTPGKGSSFVSAVIEAGCDLYITGEVGFHAAQDASRQGLTVVELGHRESELFYVKVMSEWLKDSGLPVHSLLTRAQGWV